MYVNKFGGNIVEKIIYTKFSSERKKEFAIQTSIVEIDGVKYSRKKAMYPEARRHIKRIAENCDILTKIYGKEHVAQCVKVSDDEVDTEYIDGITLSKKIEEFILYNNDDMLNDYINKYTDFLKKSCSVDEIDNLDEKIIQLDSSKRCTNIDLIFDNIIDKNGKWVIIDYEWLVPKLNYKFVLYRVLYTFEERNKYHEEILNAIRNKNSIEYRKEYIECMNVFYALVIDSFLGKYFKTITNENSIIRELKEENNNIKEENIRLKNDIIAIKSTRDYRLLEKIRKLVK